MMEELIKKPDTHRGAPVHSEICRLDGRYKIRRQCDD